MMKTIKETLEMALEALEYIHEGANNQGTHTGISWRCVSNKAEPVITDLLKALAQERSSDEQPAQQEPLTDAQIEQIFKENAGYSGNDFISFARAIEAKLKENT